MFSMSDVYSVLFIFLGILLTYPALLMAIAILLPQVSGRAENRLRETPWQSLLLGIPLVLLAIVAIGAASGAAGPAAALGFGIGILTLGVSTIGAAGLARLLAQRLSQMSTDQANDSPPAPFSALLKSAVIIELACFFPIIGWLLVWPVLVVMTTGAAVFALLRWRPRSLRNSAINVAAGSEASQIHIQ